MYPSHILQIAWRIPRPLHVSPLISNDRKFQWLLRDSYAPKTTVIDTAIIQAKEGEGCPRCGGVVYAAEQVLSKSRIDRSFRLGTTAKEPCHPKY
ncbi:hypothetical protein J437_LFUL009166 [Ladona fulva]|uniref:Uncharacterized protein n=1 Tax=Ladona fulva TaxID=123851 RepID=A0A8K0KAR0_LADFU|nr:hypothetical protein J437_LFUL009166 [Ladona fulva]